MKNIYKILAISVFAFFSIGISCSDFLNTGPTDSIPSDMVNTLEDAKRITNGMYSRIKWEDWYGANMYVMGELRGDDLRPIHEVMPWGYVDAYQFDFTPGGSNYGGFWSRIYNVLLNANSLLSLIDNFPASGQAEIDLKNDMKGQALAVRALCHFDLARLYGYPYLMDKGASLGAVIATELIPQGEYRPRGTVKETYDVVIQSLIEALPLLSKARNHGHFNFWAAKALLARAYLYMGEYDNAFKHADEIITTVGGTYSLVPNSGYISSWSRQDCSEMMLELLVTIASNFNTNYGVQRYIFGLSQEPGSMVVGVLIPSKKWLDLIDEDPDDVRRGLLQVGVTGDRWLRKFAGNSVSPPNYGLHNPVLIRLSEVYLIAAEAALSKPSPDQAKANQYLDAIRKRANPNVSSITATVDEVLKERRKEFIGEGHRFFDLSRLGKTIDRTYDHVLPINNTYKEINPWNPSNFHKVVLPITNTQRIANPEGAQNPGYPD
jgi:tetratricopeptide (TPR) repeat protein